MPFFFVVWNRDFVERNYLQRFYTMEDIDLDLLVGSDPIKKFLLEKLKEIQLVNEDLEMQITRRREMSNSYLERVATKTNDNILEVTDTWQKIFHGKWIIGIEVKVTDESEVVENLDAILQWDAPTPLIYTTNCFTRFKKPSPKESNLPKQLQAIIAGMEKPKSEKCKFVENECIRATTVERKATVVVAVPIPNFVDRQNYLISGILTYRHIDKLLQLNIPTVDISFQNVTNTLMDFKKYDLISGDEKSYLTILSGSEATHLIAEYESKETSLETRLEFDCMFKKIHVIAKRKTMFIVDCLSEVAHNTLIVVEHYKDNTYDFILYTRDADICSFVLNHIYKSIPNILILMRQHKNILLSRREVKSVLDRVLSTSDAYFQEQLKTFLRSMEAQLFLMQQFCDKKLERNPSSDNTEEINLNEDVGDYQKFRLRLSDLEHQTDVLYNVVSSVMENLNIIGVGDDSD